MPSSDRPDPTAWDLLRRALPAAAGRAAETEAAPFGFAARVAAQYAALHREQKQRLWARLSLQGALASAALLVATALVAATLPERDTVPLLSPPSLDLPIVP